MERPLDLVADRARSKETEPLADAVAQVGVPPPRIEMDRERAIHELGKARVRVAGERRERASRRLHEDHAFPAASRRRDLGPASSPVELDSGDRPVASRRAEQDRARTAVARRAVERDLASRDAQYLHDRIGLEEMPPEERAQPEECGAAVLGRHRVDEVLHRVRRDHFAVVALGVRAEEPLTGDVDVHRRRERRQVAPAEPVEDHVGLAVADLGPRHGRARSRSAAIARNSSIPAASSGSRSCVRRSRRTVAIAAFVRPFTQTTNRKPKRRS